MPSAPHSQRNAAADLLKGVAVVLMIQVHIVEQFATEEVLHSTIGSVSLFLGGPPAAPVFLAVMGFFAVQSSRTFASHLRRGIYLIGGGLLLNLGLNAHLLYTIATGRRDLDPLAFVFGADILPLAGLSVIVLALLTNTGGKHPLTLLTASLVCAALAPVLSDVGADSPFQYVVPFLWGKQWWSYFPLFPWLSYALLGAAVGATPQELRVRVTYRTLAPVFIVLLIALLATAPSALPLIVDLSKYYHHGIVLMLWVSAFLIVWTTLVSVVERRAGGIAVMRYLKWLGRNVTAAYVFQWLLIGNIATALYRTQSLWQSCFWFCAILIATTLLVLAFRAMKQPHVNGSA